MSIDEPSNQHNEPTQTTTAQSDKDPEELPDREDEPAGSNPANSWGSESEYPRNESESRMAETSPALTAGDKDETTPVPLAGDKEAAGMPVVIMCF